MKSYYFAKALHKMRISSFNHCSLDSTAKVDSECTLAKVTMGRYSYVGAGTRITDTSIGNFCSIGGHCGIGGGIHPTDMVSTSPVFLKGRNILGKNFAEIPYEPSKTVEIGNDVWIGEGAVVTKDVNPYSVVGGVPAKEIRKRFEDQIAEKLLKIKWWDWPDETLEKYGQYFENPNALIEMIEKM